MDEDIKVHLRDRLQAASDIILARQQKPGWADEQQRIREIIGVHSAEVSGMLDSFQRESARRSRDWWCGGRGTGLRG